MRHRRPKRRAIGLWNGTHPRRTRRRGRDTWAARSTSAIRARQVRRTLRWNPRTESENDSRAGSRGRRDHAASRSAETMLRVPIRMLRGLDRKRATAEAAINRFLEESRYGA